MTVDYDRLWDSIQGHEGYSWAPYLDTRRIWTVGWGHALHHEPIPRDTQTLHAVLQRLTDRRWHEEALGHDIGDAIRTAKHWAGKHWRSLSSARQEVIVEMAFQLGHGGLAGFTKFRSAIADGDWERAAAEMKASRWHEQTTNRAERLIEKWLRG